MLSWIIVGLVAGYLAKLIFPGPTSRGWISSLILGVLGSYVGGIIGRTTGLNYILGVDEWVGSIVVATGGAFLVLWLYNKFVKHRYNCRRRF